jgi:hypothetical protein
MLQAGYHLVCKERLIPNNYLVLGRNPVLELLDHRLGHSSAIPGYHVDPGLEKSISIGSPHTFCG